ncbi:hypothetical protein EYS14_24735 [Alteromonadaceae bacterium M269]|nr:hypothetical protein EYS14_24735 [Alteromonadaceae bacterium M269]
MPKSTHKTKAAYVVFVGRKLGVYTSFKSLKKQIKDYPLAWYKAYKHVSEAKKEYRQWKKRHALTPQQLLTLSEKIVKESHSTHQCNQQRYAKLIKWCYRMEKSKRLSLKDIRKVVKIAKQQTKHFTVNDLDKALTLFQDNPPWDIA